MRCLICLEQLKNIEFLLDKDCSCTKNIHFNCYLKWYNEHQNCIICHGPTCNLIKYDCHYILLRILIRSIICLNMVSKILLILWFVVSVLYIYDRFYLLNAEEFQEHYRKHIKQSIHVHKT